MSDVKKDNVDSQMEQLYDEIEKNRAAEAKKTKPERKLNELFNGMESEARAGRDGNELLRFFSAPDCT